MKCNVTHQFFPNTTLTIALRKRKREKKTERFKQTSKWTETKPIAAKWASVFEIAIYSGINDVHSINKFRVLKQTNIIKS